MDVMGNFTRHLDGDVDGWFRGRFLHIISLSSLYLWRSWALSGQMGREGHLAVMQAFDFACELKADDDRKSKVCDFAWLSRC